MSGKARLRLACGLLITLAFLFTSVLPVGAQAPTNDNFANAISIGSTPYDDEQDIYSASLEPGEPSPSCLWGDSFGHTIWYAYTPDARGSALGYISKDYPAILAVYTGDDLGSLTEIGCWRNVSDYAFQVQPGETYYLQFGGMWDSAGWMHLRLFFFLPPSNDNFTDAMSIALGDTLGVDNTAASVEPGEPSPSCLSPNKTVWFRYTSTSSGLVTADPSEWWNFVVIYAESGPGNLTEVGCRGEGDPLTFHAEAGTTYYFQVGGYGDGYYGWFTFHLFETPPPVADFWVWTNNPNVYDNIEFCDASYDPVYAGFSDYIWDFGDGVSTTGNCVYHQFAADGDYSVWHNVQTTDGRTDPDGVTKTITIRTHDVAIRRVTAPKAASVGQTRQITVYIKNYRYPERVDVQLYKSAPGGYQSVGVTTQTVPVRTGNRTTPISFSYTFTEGDGVMGKVTFKAVVVLLDGRDALPADNEAISPPTKVQ